MAIINVTPVMTSNTSPSPYVASSSTNYSSSYLPYNAFNRVIEREGWCSASNTPSGWIGLDFKEPTSISGFSISIGEYRTEVAPKDFELMGSNNGSDFVTIEIFTGVTGWSFRETRFFDLNKVCEYQQYRLKINTNNGYHYSSIAELSFYIDTDYLKVPVSHKNASLAYTLPMATTEKIKSKSNDKRVGLLGMANDDENFGDLYVVGKDGKSHLTKSGIKSEILFEGNASVLNEKYVLSKPITDFKMLVFFSNASSSTSSGFNTTSVVVNVDDIKYINNEFYVNLYQGGYERNFNFTIHNDNISFSITRQTLGGLSSMQITKVIGIY